jgi:hypothetical protein
MRLGVYGSKEFKNAEYVAAIINDYLAGCNVFISANKKGACQFAYEWVKEYNASVKAQGLEGQLTTVLFDKDLDYSNEEATKKRDMSIINLSDVLVVFWDNADLETRNFINEAVKANKYIIIHCVGKLHGSIY